MAIKVSKIDNYIVITDNDVSVFEAPASKTLYKIEGSELTIYNDVNQGSGYAKIKALTTNFKDEDGNDFASGAVAWLRENTGFSSASGGSGAGGSTTVTAKTGSTLVFTAPAFYNTITPATTDFTLDPTDGVAGVTVFNDYIGSLLPSITVVGEGSKLRANFDAFLGDNSTVNSFGFVMLPNGDIRGNVSPLSTTVLGSMHEVDVAVDNATTAGDSVPSQTVIDKMKAFIDGLKDLRDDADTTNTNIFERMDAIYLMIGNTEDLSRYNIVDGVKTITDIGTPTFGVNGFTGATSAALNVRTSFKANSSNFTVNDCSLYMYQSGLTSSGSTYLAGMLGTDTSHKMMIGYNNSTNSWLHWCNNTSTGVTAATYAAGGVLMDRSSSTEYKFYVDGSLIDTETQTSNDVPDTDFYVLARNNGGVNAPTDATVGVVMYGASIDGYANSLETLVESTINS